MALTVEQQLEKARQAKAKAEKKIALIKAQADKQLTREKILAGAVLGILLREHEADPKWFMEQAQKRLKAKDFEVFCTFVKRNLAQGVKGA